MYHWKFTSVFENMFFRCKLLEQKGYMEKRVEPCLYLCLDFILSFSLETQSNSKSSPNCQRILRPPGLWGTWLNFRKHKLIEHWCKLCDTLIQAVVKSQDVLACPVFNTTWCCDSESGGENSWVPEWNCQEWIWTPWIALPFNDSDSQSMKW